MGISDMYDSLHPEDIGNGERIVRIIAVRTDSGTEEIYGLSSLNSECGGRVVVAGDYEVFIVSKFAPVAGFLASCLAGQHSELGTVVEVKDFQGPQEVASRCAEIQENRNGKTQPKLLEALKETQSPDCQNNCLGYFGPVAAVMVGVLVGQIDVVLGFIVGVVVFIAVLAQWSRGHPE